ncbi:MAG TPA: protein-glutamate O-methyltransferase CheR [Geobacterales bacterium]|nr:protein-glutamate O-methyltransferase CheR [Geobacterales bacterium]
MKPASPPAFLHQEAPSVTQQEFAKFCEFFYRKTGIIFTENKRYFVERRILERMVASQCPTFREYFATVRFETAGQEMQRLVNAMTVNETYFFREDYQFDTLVSGILPELAVNKKPGDTIRIWSLPCSTGEEPYSIAIYILEGWDRADDFNIEIIASDIDSQVLSQAQEGIYGERALSRIPPDIRQKYFSSVGGGSFQILAELRESIDFFAVNVVDDAQMRQNSNIDIIFCRNLLIYFDDLARRQAMETMYECLAPGGFICLGHSESMSRMSSLYKPRRIGDSIVYQKP